MQMAATVFVSGLPEGAQGSGFKAQLRDQLAMWSPRRIRVEKDADGRTRGWAFVQVASADAVVAAAPVLTLQEGEATYRLSVSPTLGKVDTAFPDETYDVRRRIQLDTEAHMSVTDQHTANRMTGVVAAMLTAAGSRLSECVVTDAAACAGGNTASFARQCKHVHAVEMDAPRCELLRQNLQMLNVADTTTVHCADYSDGLCETLQQDVVFCDPPWGGTNYSQNSTIPDLHLGQLSMTAMCDLLIDRQRCCMLVLKLPAMFDFDSLAKHLVRPRTSSTEGLAGLDERPFPFMFEFGRTRLFVTAYTANAASRCGAVFANRTLDSVIAAINAWNVSWHNAHHPRFFDWEKQRWISLGRWKGCTPAVST